jgi:hypothetical protein
MIEEFYKRKIIRDFLSLFSETKWKELLFHLVEYAIIMLKRNYNVASLSLDDIIAILDDLKEEETRRFRQNMRELGNNRTNYEVEAEKAPSDWRKGINKVLVKKPTKEVKKVINKKPQSTYPEWWNEEEKQSSKAKLVKLYLFRIGAIAQKDLVVV